MNEVQINSVFVSAKGGVLSFVSEQGEVLIEVAIPPGLVPAREYLNLAPEGAYLQVSDGLVLRNPKGGYGLQVHECQCETGANPDFQPTSADRLQRTMRIQMQQLQQQSKAVEAKLRALSKVERIPDARADEKPAKADPEGEAQLVE